jgi:DNA-binding NtrC family response regulator
MIRLAFYSQDLRLRSLLAPALGPEFQIVVEPDEAQLKDLLSQGSCDVVILDLDSSDALESQILFFEEIVASHIPVIVMADDEARAEAVELAQRGAFGYCRKPPALRELKPLVRAAFEQRSLKRELEATRELAKAIPSCDRLVGSSPQMLTVYDLIRKVTNIDASVLVIGESGTGKELVASAIHNLGNRACKPFVAVSCGAIPETLIEAELFGHEKGAYTGTVGAREGFLEKASDGTLFLDEIGELSLQTQVKLLRVLQQREFSRLGSTRLIPLKARLIFATHRNLLDLVAAGKFRQDFYYRINVMRIDCPSLADHPQDIPQLAHQFLLRYSTQHGKPVDSIQPQALVILENYAWPGNVRELENVIQRAVILAEGNAIRPKDLPETLREESFVPTKDDDLLPGSFERLLRDYKIKLAINAVQECNGNKTLAARRLNISRAYLHRLLRPAEQVEAGIQEIHVA